MSSEPKTEGGNQIGNGKLDDAELDKVAGGNGVSAGGGLKGVLASTKGGNEGGSGGQNDPAQMFQQILQQLTQGQGQG
jgi:hypothetical protein